MELLEACVPSFDTQQSFFHFQIPRIEQLEYLSPLAPLPKQMIEADAERVHQILFDQIVQVFL